MSKINFFLVITAVLVMAVACSRSDALPPVGKIYLATANSTNKESAANQAENNLAEIDALMAWAADQERVGLLGQATQAELDWLQNAGMPDDVQRFFALAEPQSSLESAGVSLVPVSLLRENVSAVEPVKTAYQYGCVVIAKTISGDFYCLDVLQEREDGTSPIYLVNHDKMTGTLNQEEFWLNSNLVAYSFTEFLEKFMAGSLPYVHAQAWGTGNPNRARDGYDGYLDEKGRFRLRYPDTWLVAAPADAEYQVSFINPSLGSQTNRVVFTILVQKPTRRLERLADAAEAFIRQQPGVTNFLRHAQIGVVVNGLSGIERETSYTLNNTTFNQRTLYLAHPDSTYVLNFLLPSGELNKYDATMQKIIRSFSVP